MLPSREAQGLRGLGNWAVWKWCLLLRPQTSHTPRLPSR